MLVFFLAIVLATEPLEVRVTNGVLKGAAVGDHARQFAGIPFASPPVGELRFKRPVPPADWSGVRDAAAFAPDCAQKKTAYINFHNISEDCLYLNVFATQNTPAKPLPVMVFFYGGSWEWGGTSFPIYNGDFMENYADDVVVVTVNYRLGPFGFLGSRVLAKEDSQHSTGNYGLQDQRMAMQWVHDNIAAFKGDPKAVTIWGESAGAGSVSTHLVTKESWPLFHQGIMESGPPANWTSNTLDEADSHYQRIVAKLKCNGTDEQQLACLRSQSMKTLLDNQENGEGALVDWTPIVDGVEMTKSPPVLVRSGDYHKVPILFGSNRDEGTTFININHKANATEFAAWVAKQLKLGTKWTDKVLKMYPLEEFNTPWFAAARLYGDAAMSCPVRRNARWMTQGNDTTTPVFVYWFTHVPAVTAADAYLGVAHAFELPFVFDFWPLLLEPAERALAHHFTTYWTNFAVHGDPNVGKPVAFQWPRYSVSTDENINLSLEITANAHLKNVECDLWDAIFEDQHQ